MPGSLATQPAVLLVEDDDTIGSHLADGLRSHGHPTRWCRTGSAALIEARDYPTDVVLLDLGLPDLDGIDVARDLRQRHPELLIIMLTARGEDIDVVAGLDVGADDYLIKPVRLSVLLARLRAHLRRHPLADAHHLDEGERSSRILTVGDLTIDTGARRCHLASTEVTLRPKEFDLLTHLAGQPGVAVPREELMANVWDEHWFGSTKTLDVTMAALRRRIEDAAGRAALPVDRTPTITTLRSHGYRLEP